MSISVVNRQNYLKTLLDYKDKKVIKIITGIRRCGKSTLLELFAKKLQKTGVSDKQIIKVKVGGDRTLIFDEVVVRVSPDFATYMHVDYDEYNAAALSGSNNVGEILN